MALSMKQRALHFPAPAREHHRPWRAARWIMLLGLCLLLASVAHAQLGGKAPVAGDIDPDNAVAGGPAFTLTVTGFNFSPTTQVTWDGNPVPTTFVSGTRVTANISRTLLVNNGSTDITVAVGVIDTGISSPIITVPFTIHPAVQNQFSINSISPSSVTAGASSFTLRVLGGIFDNTCTVKWNGTSRTTNFINSGEVDATISASDVASPGTAQVTVTKGTDTTNALTFTIGAVRPTLTNISPSSVGAGAAAFTLTATGTNFASGINLFWGGSARTTTFVSSTTLTAAITAADVATARTVQVYVSQSGLDSGALTFTVTANAPDPVVNSLSPTQATAAGAAFTLTVNGANFVSGATVLWNGVSHTTTFVNSTQLTAAISAGDIATAANVSVTVRNPNAAVSNAVTFFVVGAVPPVITSISPDTAYQNGPAFTMTVTGSSFQPSAQVTFNASPRTTTFVGSTQLTAAILASDITQVGAPAAQIRVTQGGITSSGSVNFFVNTSATTVGTLSPTSATAGSSGLSLTVNGTNFISNSAGTPTVMFNGSARTTTYVNSTQLVAQLGAADLATAGNFSISVRQPNPPGNLSSNVANFTVSNPVPTIRSVSPGVVDTSAGAFSLTVVGTGFTRQSVVRWNGSSRTTTFVSGTQLTASILAADITAPGQYPVTVNNPIPAGGTTPTFVNMQVVTPGGWPTALPNFQYIPHLLSGIGFVTRVTLTNLTLNLNTVTLWYLEQPGYYTTETYTLQPAQTIRVSTAESARFNAVRIQWLLAAVQSARQTNGAPNLGVNLFFEWSPSGGPPNITNTVGFNDVAQGGMFVLPLELEPAPQGASIGKTVGLALASSGASGAVTLKLVDRNGNLLATKTVNLSSFQQIILSVQDPDPTTGCPEFAAVLPNSNFIGMLVISSVPGITGIALLDDYGQFSASPLVPVTTLPR